MMTAAVVATAIGSSASAGTIFNTTTNDLSGTTSINSSIRSH